MKRKNFVFVFNFQKKQQPIVRIFQNQTKRFSKIVLGVAHLLYLKNKIQNKQVSGFCFQKFENENHKWYLTTSYKPIKRNTLTGAMIRFYHKKDKKKWKLQLWTNMKIIPNILKHQITNPSNSNQSTII